MSAPEYSIAVRAPGGTWERLGSGAMSAAVPRGITHVHGPRGPETLSCELGRGIRAALPDEMPFTEVIGTLGNVPVFSGRWMRAPRTRGQDASVRPVGEGWMTSHLQDYPIDREWVITDLSRWVDSRTLSGANLTNHTMAGNASVTGGQINLGWKHGEYVKAQAWLGVTLDLGPSNTAKRFVMNVGAKDVSSGIQIYVRAHPNPDGGLAGGNDAYTVSLDLIPVTSSGTFATPHRYVSVFLYNAGMGAGEITGGLERTLIIKSLSIFTNTAYESGAASALKASTVVSDVLDLAPKISTDRSGITTTTFNIPAYGTGGRRAIADIVNDVNAYHQWQFYGTPDPNPRPIYRPVPTTPTWVVSETMAYEYEDAGANEGAEIIDTCILQYTDATGVPMEYIATAANTVFAKVGYSRAKVLQARSRLTPAAAQQIAQAYVAAHQTSPFKGKIRIRNKIMRASDGALVDVGLITANDGVIISGELDPALGTPGRLGIIQKVTYNHDELTADLELDSSRTYIDAVLSRLAIVVR